MRPPLVAFPLVLLVLLVLLVPLPALAGPTANKTILAPIADATANQDQPTTNYGASAELSFGKDYMSSPTFRVWFTRGHVQFDLSGLNVVPARARFFWYQSRSSAAGCLDVNLHRLTQPWTESTVDWTNKPTHDAAVVATACVGNSFALGWKSFDVTPLVRDWIRGVHPNHGFVIRDPRETTAGAARPGHGHSRESTSAALRPYLELEWHAPYGAGCAPAMPLPSLDLLSPSVVGGTLVLEGKALPATVPGVLLLGGSRTTWGALPLPLDLGFLGHTGCQVLASGELQLGIATSATGVATLPIGVPNSPMFSNVSLYAQMLAFSGPALSLTHGLQVVIR